MLVLVLVLVLVPPYIFRSCLSLSLSLSLGEDQATTKRATLDLLARAIGAWNDDVSLLSVCLFSLVLLVLSLFLSLIVITSRSIRSFDYSRVRPTVYLSFAPLSRLSRASLALLRSDPCLLHYLYNWCAVCAILAECVYPRLHSVPQQQQYRLRGVR